MCDATADGAAIADLVVRDLTDRGLEQGMRGIEPRVVLDVEPAHHGAEPHAGVGDLDPPQLGELAEIDDERGRGDAERHHRHQALAAGEYLGVAVARPEQRHRLAKRRRAGIVEGGEFHPMLGCAAQRGSTFPSIAGRNRST